MEQVIIPHHQSSFFNHQSSITLFLLMIDNYMIDD